MDKLFGSGTNKAIKKVKAASKGLKPYNFAYGTIWAKSEAEAKRKLQKELKTL